MSNSNLKKARSVKKECENRLEKLEKDKAKLARKKNKYNKKIHLTTIELEKLKEIEKQINELTVLRYQALLKCEQIADNIVNIGAPQYITNIVSPPTPQPLPPPPPPIQKQILHSHPPKPPPPSESIKDIEKELDKLNNNNSFFNKFFSSYDEKKLKDDKDNQKKKYNEEIVNKDIEDSIKKINKQINYITSSKYKDKIQLDKINESLKQKIQKTKDMLETILKELDKSIEDAEKLIYSKYIIQNTVLENEYKKYESTISKYYKLKDSLAPLSSYTYDDQRVITSIEKRIELLNEKIKVIKNNQLELKLNSDKSDKPTYVNIGINTEHDTGFEDNTDVYITPKSNNSNIRIKNEYENPPNLMSSPEKNIVNL